MSDGWENVDEQRKQASEIASNVAPLAQQAPGV
jgi:hypothetical protein